MSCTLPRFRVPILIRLSTSVPFHRNPSDFYKTIPASRRRQRVPNCGRVRNNREGGASTNRRENSENFFSAIALYARYTHELALYAHSYSVSGALKFFKSPRTKKLLFENERRSNRSRDRGKLASEETVKCR